MGFVPYQPCGPRCLGRAQPGAKAFLAELIAEFHGGNDGIYSCRHVAGSRTRSLHSEGRAVDLHVYSIEQGQHIVNVLLPVVGRLGVQLIIFNRRIYSGHEPGGKHYSGVDAHQTHLHIELGWPAALKSTRASVRAVLAGKVPPASPSSDGGPVGAFPLPEGHWYGPDDGSLKSHSGARPVDQMAIKAIQREVVVQQTGHFDAITATKCSVWKKAHQQPGDPLVGQTTWNLMRIR